MSTPFRHAADSDVTSTIAARDRARGDLHVGGGLRVEGVIRGHIKPTSADAALLLAPKARIEGDVHVSRARIQGRVTGSLDIEGHLEVASGAVIEGDVRYRSMTIAAGATVNGHLHPRHLDEVD